MKDIKNVLEIVILIFLAFDIIVFACWQKLGMTDQNAMIALCMITASILVIALIKAIKWR